MENVHVVTATDGTTMAVFSNKNLALEYVEQMKAKHDLFFDLYVEEMPLDPSWTYYN